MKRRYVLTVCGASIGLLTGCFGNAPDTGGGGDTTLSNGTTTEIPSQETTAPASRDSERNATPHEFVHVEAVENQSNVDTASVDETIAFPNLSAQRQQTFREALDQDTVAADGWSYYNESRPEYVRYDGSWFRVIVGVH